jgi:hypothetical protein
LCSASGQPALAGGLWLAQDFVRALVTLGGQAALAARFRRQVAVLRKRALLSRNALAALLAISRLFSTLIDAKPRLDVLIFGSPGSRQGKGLFN